MKKILVLTYSDLSVDARIKRQIQALQELDFQVSVASYKKSQVENILHIDIFHQPKFSLLRKVKRFSYLMTNNYDGWYWDAGKIDFVKRMSDSNFDIIVANDLITLPLATKLSEIIGAKVLFDAHEYAPREFENDSEWIKKEQPRIKFLCKKYIPKADSCITVCRPVAREYKKHYSKDFSIVMNAPAYRVSAPKKVEQDKIRLVYHGAASESRKINTILDVFERLDSDKFEIDFYLVYYAEEEHIVRFKNRIKEIQGARLLKPIPIERIVDVLSEYDLGLSFIPPINFNYINAVSNKFLDYIQARLANVTTAECGEMASIITEKKLGKVAKEFSVEEMAKTVSSFTREEIFKFKQSVDDSALELSWDTSKEVLKGVVKDMLCVE